LAYAGSGTIISSQTVHFAGYKVGAPTGFFFMGGSLAIGILLVVIIVLIVLFIRQKNVTADEVEEIKTKAYLKELVEKAQKEGMSKSAAEEAAKKLIGATWDTSHISMMRKQGFKADK